MRLKPGAEDEYRRLHANLWPQLATLLKIYGISNYSIYLIPDSPLLIAILEYEDWNLFQLIGDEPVMKQWWVLMEPLMVMDVNGSPQSIPIDRLFYLP